MLGIPDPGASHQLTTEQRNAVNFFNELADADVVNNPAVPGLVEKNWTILSDLQSNNNLVPETEKAPVVAKKTPHKTPHRAPVKVAAEKIAKPTAAELAEADDALSALVSVVLDNKSGGVDANLNLVKGVLAKSNEPFEIRDDKGQVKMRVEIATDGTKTVSLGEGVKISETTKTALQNDKQKVEVSPPPVQGVDVDNSPKPATEA